MTIAQLKKKLDKYPDNFVVCVPDPTDETNAYGKPADAYCCRAEVVRQRADQSPYVEITVGNL